MKKFYNREHDVYLRIDDPNIPGFSQGGFISPDHTLDAMMYAMRNSMNIPNSREGVPNSREGRYGPEPLDWRNEFKQYRYDIKIKTDIIDLTENDFKIIEDGEKKTLQIPSTAVEVYAKNR
jgi:hypothetical protein